jgi:type IV pilus assembly protein PilA
MIVVAIIGILAAIAIPAYQDYTIRAQVSEGLSLSGGAKAAISEFTMDTGRFPSDNATAGVSASADITGKYVSDVLVTDGTIQVTYDGPDAHAQLAGKMIELVPTTNAGSVDWLCQTGTTAVDSKHLPSACRP